jgi:excinuclease ABC subunit C
MAAQNAAETLAYLRAQWAADESKQTEGLAELQQALNLSEPPLRIECYDISTLQGTNTVGSMTVFVKGIPRKSDYRRFKIQTVQGQNDYAGLQEMLRRRFKRMADDEYSLAQNDLARGEDNDNPWSLIPNLVIIDGGKGELNAALEVLEDFGLREVVPVVGLAKREEEIFIPGVSEPVLLPHNSQGLFLIQRIRDETHRFGVTYHRKLRGKSAVHSRLDDIEGIGPKRRKALMQKFGSVEAIRQATIDELAAVPGMTKRAAEALKEQL